MVSDELVLGAEFPSPARDDWLALVERVVGDAGFDSLVSTTYDGLRIQPVYTADDLDVSGDPAGLPASGSHVRGGSASGHVDGGWDVRQRLTGEDAEAVNRAVLVELERGSTSVLLDLPTSLAADLGTVLRGVYLDLAAVCFVPGDTRIQSQALRALWDDQSIPVDARLASLGLDPITDAARTGADATPFLADLVPAAAAAFDHPGVRPIAVDASPYADAGASEAVELACSVAAGVTYLRALTDAGLGIDEACAQLEFTYTAGADQFLTVAKLRAARRLWARVVEASGGSADARRQVQHAVTAGAMMTRRDPWVNMLRTTIACFAAGVAGADSVTVQPFDAAIGVSDDFARRVARNTQLLLIEESNLARVIDPAGGSWYVEDLTERLALEAWTRFQEIEAAGGLVTGLADGTIAAMLDDTWRARLVNLAHRRDPITGVTEFPNLGEVRLDRPSPPRPASGGLPLRRYAVPFEALRDAAEAAGERPSIFLANLGPVATHTARASFATNLFEIGGIAARGNDGFEDAAAVADAFRSSGSPLAVICSSDRRYEEMAADVARALRAAGAERVYLAGHPGGHRDRYLEAGIDEFVHLGCDVLAVLRGAHELLGLPTTEAMT